MKKQVILISVFMFFVLDTVNGQSFSVIEDLLEENAISENTDDYEEIVANLIAFYEHPLDINSVGFDSLKMLYFLSDSQIDLILKYRQKKGKFMHLNELLWVYGIGKRDLNNIRPFISLNFENFGDRLDVIRDRSTHELLTRLRTTLPRQEGYTSYSQDYFEDKEDYEAKRASRFQGPPIASLVRYKYKVGDYLQAGVTLENDAGEAYFGEYQPEGFDFVSAHMSINTTTFIDKVIIGDYKLQWGQGLVAWGGFGSGKSSLAVANEKAYKKVSPYTSTDENNFMRGVAFSLFGGKELSGELFVSSKQVDARIVELDTLDAEDVLNVSLYTSGYHRNNAEGIKKDAINEFVTGMSFSWNTNDFRLGFNALYYDFNSSFTKPTSIYQQYNDTGSNRSLFSVDYKTSFKGFYVFGETAISETGAIATLNGVRKSMSMLSASLLYRRYARDYISRYASGFAEYSNTSNEEGVYLGMELVPVKKLKINAYIDWFRFFAPRYRAYTPTDGWEALLEVSYERGKWGHTLRVKNEHKAENITETQISATRKKLDFRYQLNYELNKSWELRTRLSYANYAKDIDKENGYMVFQDVVYMAPSDKFKVQARLAYFNTESYDSRVYAYENNVLYAYSFPMFMNEGIRSYLNMSWKISKSATCYFRAGITNYFDVDVISSGLTEVNSNKLYDLNLQLRLKL